MYVLVFIDLYSEIRESRVYIFPVLSARVSPACRFFHIWFLLNQIFQYPPLDFDQKKCLEKKGAKRTSPIIKRGKNNYLHRATTGKKSRPRKIAQQQKRQMRRRPHGQWRRLKRTQLQRTKRRRAPKFISDTIWQEQVSPQASVASAAASTVRRNTVLSTVKSHYETGARFIF